MSHTRRAPSGPVTSAGAHARTTRRSRPGPSPALLAALAIALAAPVSAAPVRVVATDARGVTLQVTVGAWSLSAPGRDGRSHLNAISGAHSLNLPGRPQLPAFAATLLLPPDGRPSVRVVATGGEQAREGVKLEIVGRPVFRDDPAGKLGFQPFVEAVEPIADGPWPTSTVSLERPYGFRGRRLVSLEIRPFRYDETSGRVSSPLTLTVRVDFNRPAGASLLVSGDGMPDRHVDGVLQASVMNWDQGRGWRQAPALAGGSPGARRSGAGSLFDRAPSGPTRAFVFEENQPEVRVRLDETALYRLDYDDLAAHGYPINVPVGEVSVHRHEFLEGATPPYGTVELPCEIEDANANGFFDSGDGIWVWVRSWAERSGASNSQRTWGDAEVVYATRRPGGGLRVPQRPGWNDVVGLTPLASYPSFKHYEHDFASFMPFVSAAQDTNIGLWHWTQFSLYYSRPDTIRVQTNDIDTTHSVAMNMRWVGRASDAHFMWAALRNGRNQLTTLVDSTQSWSGKIAVVRSATLHGSALTEGNTNFFRQWGKNGSGPPDAQNNAICFAGLDWFELTYWRSYRAVGDYVRFNTADATGDVEMNVGGFSSDSVRVYDVTDPDQPMRVTIDPAHVAGGAIELQDVVTGPRREYVAAALQNPPSATLGPRTPPASAYGTVTRRDLWATTAGDYVLVAPEAFLPALPPLEALRVGQGLSVLEAPTESIYDEFNGGRHSGAALQRFARYAYGRWDARFLTLMGNGTLDPTHARQGSAVDWIPVLPTPGPVGTNDGLEIISSDNRYGFITGPEDPLFDPSGLAVVPELMVGRLTVNTLVEADSVVAKLVRYENVKLTDTWRKNVLLHADDAYSGGIDLGGPTVTGYCHHGYEELFVTLGDFIRREIEDPDTGTVGMHVEQINQRYFLPTENHIDPPAVFDTCRTSLDEAIQHMRGSGTPVLIGKLNSGQLIWNFQGHANQYLLTHENIFVNQSTDTGDELRLRNDGMPFIFTAFSCHANTFAHPEQHGLAGAGPGLGEDLLALPSGRGAVASWASVCFEVVPANDHDHINVELMRDLFVNTPRDEFLGADDRGSRAVIGEVILTALINYVATVQAKPSERGLSVSYTLLGDPATRISIAQPNALVLANGIPVTSGEALRLHTPGNTLRIDANIVSIVRIDSLALFVNSGSGDVPVPPADYSITPPLPDTAAATGVFGGRHFKIVYVTQPRPESATYSIVARDSKGLVQRTDIKLQLVGLLRSGGNQINDYDEVPASAALSLELRSPAPIANPLAEISLKINGVAQSFTATPNPGDASGREWILAWSHADYPIDDYVVVASVQNGGSVTRVFRVTASASRLSIKDLIPFPNPFDNSGTHFSFLLTGTERADVKVHVFSLAGRSIYTGVVRGLAPGYHQLAWDGRDAEGDELGNGVYFYRVSVTTAGGATTQQLGRLVKLRRPRHVDESTVP